MEDLIKKRTKLLNLLLEMDGQLDQLERLMAERAAIAEELHYIHQMRHLVKEREKLH